MSKMQCSIRASLATRFGSLWLDQIIEVSSLREMENDEYKSNRPRHLASGRKVGRTANDRGRAQEEAPRRSRSRAGTPRSELIAEGANRC